MILPIIPLLYTVIDFLLDQKREIARLERKRLLKRKTDPGRSLEIKEQQQYLYSQGLQALRRHEDRVPDCVRTHFLADGSRPTIDEIAKELKDKRRMNYKLIRIIVVALIIALTILAITY